MGRTLKRATARSKVRTRRTAKTAGFRAIPSGVINKGGNVSGECTWIDDSGWMEKVDSRLAQVSRPASTRMRGKLVRGIDKKRNIR